MFNCARRRCTLETTLSLDRSAECRRVCVGLLGCEFLQVYKTRYRRMCCLWRDVSFGCDVADVAVLEASVHSISLRSHAFGRLIDLAISL
jgi:hypothetical protein